MIVHCPKCDEELELPEDAIGAKVQCCACEAKFFADETVVPDEFKAAALRVKAEGGDATAQYNLAVCYERGNGTEKNVGEAMRWYEAATAKNNPRFS